MLLTKFDGVTIDRVRPPQGSQQKSVYAVKDIEKLQFAKRLKTLEVS